MKNKLLLIIVLIFFLIVNTQYYWEEWLGSFALLAYLILFVLFLSMVIGLLYQIYLCVDENFKSLGRIIGNIIIAGILFLIYNKPMGVINFDKWEGENLLIAERGTNCILRIKFKDNQRFVERDLCFGVDVTRGTYRVKNDTIFLLHNFLFSKGKDYYKFAVREKKMTPKGNYQESLLFYKSENDSIPMPLRIIKNKLIK